ncbi:MAG TPA: hypothetical protein VMI35_08285 [Puia sp.]|nr:hypothetical protein [Puia sp.]
MPKYAVLTGDIVNSTLLTSATEKRLLQRLQQTLAPYKFEFYRGDSFQALIKEPLNALRVALQCRTAALSIRQGNTGIRSDVRISIGIGRVTSPVRSLGTAKGEAFILSGRAFDEMLTSRDRLSINTSRIEINEGLSILSAYINAIFSQMTVKQAEVVSQLLRGETQQAIATTLKKSKSTIHQFVISARWGEIEKLLVQYEKLINLLPS